MSKSLLVQRYDKILRAGYKRGYLTVGQAREILKLTQYPRGSKIIMFEGLTIKAEVALVTGEDGNVSQVQLLVFPDGTYGDKPSG
jgi:hypothetical protein